MKKLTVFAVAAILVFIFSASSHAWTVFISNGKAEIAIIEVEGEHLFWRQIDCTTRIQPKSKGKCIIPGGICPTAVYVTYYTEKTGYTTEKSVLCHLHAASCSNLTAYIETGKDGQNACYAGTAPW